MDIVTIIVVLILVGFGLFLLQRAPLDGTIKQIIYALVLLLVILWLISLLFGIHFPLRRTG